MIQFAQIPLVSPKPHTRRAPPKVKEKNAPKQGPIYHKEPAGPLLERPHLNITGRRHVPVLVNACRFPFLRIKKPQPPQLSRIISESIKVRERRLSRFQMLLNEMTIAEGEDLWDRILSQEFGLVSSTKESSWTAVTRAAMAEISEAQNRAIAKRMKMAEKMTDIVEKETALAEEERRNKKDLKHKERKARQLERQGRDPALAWKPPAGSTMTTPTDEDVKETARSNRQAIEAQTLADEDGAQEMQASSKFPGTRVEDGAFTNWTPSSTNKPECHDVEKDLEEKFYGLCLSEALPSRPDNTNTVT